MRSDQRDDVFILIAAYQESGAIGEVVRELQQEYRVIVVDDGSSDGTGSAARAAGAIVLRHAINRGQGAALQTALAYAVSHGAKYVITFDADGQHRAEDVARLLQPLEEGVAEIALGSRFLGRSENMPWTRLVVLKLGVLFTRLVSGISVTDTHNGLRAFTHLAASKLTITEDRMAHASELLDQVAACGLPYVEVPVTVRYTAYSRRKGQASSASFKILFNYLFRKIWGSADAIG